MKPLLCPLPRLLAHASRPQSRSCGRRAQLSALPGSANTAAAEGLRSLLLDVPPTLDAAAFCVRRAQLCALPMNEAERYLAAAEEEAKRLRAVCEGFTAASAAARRARQATQKARLYALRATHEQSQVESARELADLRELQQLRAAELGEASSARLRSADWTLDALAAYVGASQTVTESLAELGAAHTAQSLDELEALLGELPAPVPAEALLREPVAAWAEEVVESYDPFLKTVRGE